MNKTTLGAIAAATALWTTHAVAAVENIASQIQQVTLYQNQAKVERRGEVQLAAGSHELVFENLPFNLEESSLQFGAAGGSGLTVLSLDNEVRWSEQHSAGQLRDLQQQIRHQTDQIKQIQDELEAIDNQFAMLQWLQHGRLNGENLNQNISFEEFNRLQQFSRSTYAELTTERRVLTEKRQQQQHNLEQLQQEYQRLGGDNSLMQRVVRVQVQAPAAGKQALTLSYTTFNASWRPQYQLDYHSVDNRLSLQYGAKIQQSSNEDWNNIKLILSSANPIQVGEVPELQPWVIDFYQPPQLRPQTKTAAPMAREQSGMMLKNADMALVSAAPQQTIVESGVVASHFEIPGTVTLASSLASQNVVIAQLEQAASAEYAFYPNYQDNILLTVSGKNTQDYPLLGGSLRTAYNGDVIGFGYLPTLLPGQEFKQLIGEDQTVSVKAEPAKRTEENSGLINKSKVVRIETAYTLQNNRAEAVELTVYDRIPQAVEKEIVVNLLEPAVKSITLDENGRYQQKITLAPNSKQTLKKIFTVQYPQDQQLSGL